MILESFLFMEQQNAIEIRWTNKMLLSLSDSELRWLASLVGFGKLAAMEYVQFVQLAKILASTVCTQALPQPLGTSPVKRRPRRRDSKKLKISC
jgi:hypothetical protein